jgi:hypothetical protein
MSSEFAITAPIGYQPQKRPIGCTNIQQQTQPMEAKEITILPRPVAVAVSFQTSVIL